MARDPKRPLVFKLPDNWDDLPEDEQDAAIEEFLRGIVPPEPRS